MALLIQPSVAQLTNKKCLVLHQGNQFSLKDSVLILSNTIFLESGIEYTFEPVNNSISIIPASPTDSFEVCYRFMRLQTMPQHQEYTYDSNALPAAYYQLQGEEITSENELGVKVSGNITRSIHAANQSGNGMNSFMDLRISGQIDEEVYIEGYASDQNLPMSAEGNYHNVTSYEELGLKVYNENMVLQMGNMIFKENNEYINFRKQIMGISAEASYGRMVSQAGIGITLGKHYSMELPVQAGVSGPYRLNGAGQEQFITIVPGSERVMLDGKILSAGSDKDYTIDYFTSEISFNTTIVFFPNSRVFVEYEYTNQSYSRRLLNTRHTYSSDQVDAYVQLLREKDNAFKPMFTDMTEGLYDYFSGNYSISEIRYVQKDTVLSDGSSLQIYVPSRDGRTGKVVVFVPVETGEGAYISHSSGIFSWVGDGNGSHMPVTDPKSPEAQTFMEAGAQVKFTDYEKLNVIAGFSAVSTNHLNQDSLNEGFAVKSLLKSEGRELIGAYSWNALIHAEKIGGGFQPASPFLRTDQLRRATGAGVWMDNLITSGVRLGMKRAETNYATTISYDHRFHPTEGSGHHYQLDLNESLGKWQLKVNHDLASMQETVNRWQETNAELVWKPNNLSYGYRFQSQQEQREMDSVDHSKSFFTHDLFLRWGTDSEKELGIRYREDLQASGDVATPSSGTYLLNFTTYEDFGLVKWQTRNNVALNPSPEDDSDLGNIWQSRQQLSAQWWKKSVTWNVVHAINQGREMQRAYFFMAVPLGQGTHMWQDDNGNGLQELDEFYEAINPEDRQFGKFFKPTQEYTSLYQQQIEGHVQLGFTNENFPGWLSNMSFRGNWLLQQKSNELKALSEANFGHRSRSFSQLDYHIPASRTRISLSRNVSDLNQLTINGMEGGGNDNLSLELRQSIGLQVDLFVESSRGENSQNSQWQERRNFTVNENKWLGGITIMPSTGIRLEAIYRYSQKEDKTEVASSNMNQVDFRFQAATGFADIQASTKLTGIRYTGPTDTPLAYTILEALQPGMNQEFNIQLNKSVSNRFQLNLRFYSRKSEASRWVHFGQAQVSYMIF